MNLKSCRKIKKLSFFFCSLTHKKVDFSFPIKQKGIQNFNKSTVKSYTNNLLKNAEESLKNGHKLIKSVQDLKNSVQQNPLLRLSLETGLKNIPKDNILHDVKLDQFFSIVNNVCSEPPKCQDSNMIGLPFLLIFYDLIQTKHGQTFFMSEKVHQHLKKILNDYSLMLNSQASLKYLNEEEPHGWLSKNAMKFINYDQYYVDKTKPHWGFKSWNDWFTRQIRPECRPVDPKPNSIVHSCDSYPYYYQKSGKISKNPCRNLKIEDQFWLKGNHYSLYDMLGARKMNLTEEVLNHFVGGTLYQAYLDPWCYHRWHSPISGTIIKSYCLEGMYYFLNPNLQETGKRMKIENFIEILPMLSAVCTRHVFIMRLDDGSKRHIAVIQIGLTQVSSCKPIVIQGQKVIKGQQLGRFELGGSALVILFDKDLDLQFNPQICIFDKKTHSPKKQLVNSWLATYK